VGAGTQAFAATTTKEFTSTPFPLGVVHIFLGGLPFAETILGLFITVGLLSRWVLTLGGLLITALLFGTALRSDWTTIDIQRIYSITYYLLLINRSDSHFSI